MKYYKVKPEADNKRRRDSSIYIANELYTEKETAKFKLDKSFLEVIDVPKTKIYWFFGARFAMV